MTINKVFSTIDELNDKYVDIWEDVCNIESPTVYKIGVDAVADYFVNLAKKLDLAINIQDDKKAGKVVCITLNPDVKAQPIVFSGHIDTVHPIGLFGTPVVRRDDQKIYGPGVTDCKGGVVASMLAIESLAKCGFNKRPVKLIIQSDEETGSSVSDKQTIKFMIENAKDAVAFLNAEGIKRGKACVYRKGILRVTFAISGKAAHSARCFNGANAICEAAHKIIELEKMKDADSLTCNCGVISGGTVANTVAEKCEFVADIRFSNREQYDKAIEICKQNANHNTIEGCSCEIVNISVRPAMPLVDKNVALLQKMNEIYKNCGMPQLELSGALGGSDASYTTEADIPTVDSIGIDGDNIHSINEFAYIKSLAECAKRLAAVAFYI